MEFIIIIAIETETVAAGSDSKRNWVQEPH